MNLPNGTTNDRWELVEVFDGRETVVGRYTDEQRARRAWRLADLSGAPTEPGDIWDESIYYVRRAPSTEDRS